MVLDVVVERGLEKRGKKQVTPPPTTLGEVLGNGKSVLVGMPGAFTPVCTDRHLPGLFAAGDKFAALGVNVAVVTTNDRFVNTGWAESVEACAKVNASGVVMLSDVKGELIEQLGLSAEMGDGLGTCSKRFVLIVNDGLIEYVAVDDGLESLRSTSAEALLRNLDPEYGQKAAPPPPPWAPPESSPRHSSLPSRLAEEHPFVDLLEPYYDHPRPPSPPRRPNRRRRHSPTTRRLRRRSTPRSTAWRAPRPRRRPPRQRRRPRRLRRAPPPRPPRPRRRRRRLLRSRRRARRRRRPRPRSARQRPRLAPRRRRAAASQG